MNWSPPDFSESDEAQLVAAIRSVGPHSFTTALKRRLDLATAPGPWGEPFSYAEVIRHAERNDLPHTSTTFSKKAATTAGLIMGILFLADVLILGAKFLVPLVVVSVVVIPVIFWLRSSSHSKIDAWVSRLLTEYPDIPCRANISKIPPAPVAPPPDVRASKIPGYSVDEDKGYGLAYEEFHSKNRDISLFAKFVVAESGNEDRAEARYIESRAIELAAALKPKKRPWSYDSEKGQLTHRETGLTLTRKQFTIDNTHYTRGYVTQDGRNEFIPAWQVDE